MNRYLINESKENIEKYYDEYSFGTVHHYIQEYYNISQIQTFKLIQFAEYYYKLYNIHTQFIDFCLYYNYLVHKNSEQQLNKNIISFVTHMDDVDKEANKIKINTDVIYEDIIKEIKNVRKCNI